MRKNFSSLFISILLSSPVPVCAESGLEFAINSWVTTGQTKWRHDASALNSDYGVPTSELDYQGVNSLITEVGILNNLPTGHGLRLTIGSGLITEGTLVDDDYLSAEGAVNYGATQSGAHRFSRTHSDIDGNGVFYLKGEFIPRGLQYKKSMLDIGFSFGLHYWQEEYTASGIRQIECTVLVNPKLRCSPAGTVSHTGVTVITNRVEWTGLGIAMNSLLNFTDRLAFQFDLTVYPLMSLVNEDTHHLRSDLAQDPSVRMTGGGMGYDLLAGLTFQVTSHFSAHLGYRLWERWVKDQTITFYGANGGASSARLMDFNTRREGFMLGVGFIF